jgi:hypothetical protein
VTEQEVLPAVIDPVPHDDVATPATRRRRAASRTVAALMGVLLLGAAGAGLPDARPWSVPDRPPPPSGPGSSTPATTGWPSPGSGSLGVPVGYPQPAPAGGGPHAFVALQADGSTPVAYDPCRPIHYVVRPAAQPDGGAEVLALAVRRLSAVTGLQFIDDGITDERATSGERPSFQPERYGDRWAPVLVSWDTDDENQGLAGDVVGLAGSTWRGRGSGPRVYLTGTISLDGPQLADVLELPDGRRIAVAIVEHELAHLVGLDHVDDPTQLMYPEAQDAVTDFGAGDLTGLAQLGSGPCAPTL